MPFDNPYFIQSFTVGTLSAGHVHLDSAGITGFALDGVTQNLQYLTSDGSFLLKGIPHLASPNAVNDITSQPTTVWPDVVRTDVLNGDFTHSYLAQFTRILGANTLGNPAAGQYFHSNETSASFVIYDTTTSGKNNGSTSAADGRTMAHVHRAMLYHGGQGDAAAFQAYCELYSAGLPGATHWLANAAISVMSGDLGVTSGDHTYLNTMEFNHSDNGFDIAAIGLVLNFKRTNATAAFGEVWMGHRVQANGSQPIDVGYSLTGFAKRGLDTSGTTFDADLAAVTLGAGHRIYFGTSQSPLNGVNWFSNVLSNVWMGDDGGVSLNINIDGTGFVKLNGTQLLTFRRTGYTPMTGTADIASAFDTATVTLVQLARRVMALQKSLTEHGLIGA